jgi:hypothetical protein
VEYFFLVVLAMVAISVSLHFGTRIVASAWYTEKRAHTKELLKHFGNESFDESDKHNRQNQKGVGLHDE